MGANPFWAYNESSEMLGCNLLYGQKCYPLSPTKYDQLLYLLPEKRARELFQKHGINNSIQLSSPNYLSNILDEKSFDTPKSPIRL